MPIDLKEVLFIEQNKHIKDKLMVLSIYMDYQNLLLNYLGPLNCIGLKPYDYIEAASKEFISLIDNTNEDISSKEFLDKYFENINNNNKFNLPPISTVTKEFNKKKIQVIRNSKDAKIIDDFDGLSLPNKVQILETYRILVSDSVYKIFELYGPDKPCSLINRFRDTSLEYLDDFLSYNQNMFDDMVELSSNMIESITEGSKKFFMSELLDNRFDFEDIQEHTSREAFDELDDAEQKYWLIDLMYYLSGYALDKPIKISNKLTEQLNYMGVTTDERNKIEFKMKIMTFKRLVDDDLGSQGLR